MISVEEALAAILVDVPLTPGEIVPLDRCHGLAPVQRRLTARVNVPPFDNSAMDGFAVRAADTPGELRLVGEVAAGTAGATPVEPGTTVRIMTGAPLPPGADAVAPLEIADERDEVVLVPAVQRGAHVRPAGGDTRAGDELELPDGPLSAAGVAVLASLGVGEVEVHRPPRVAILSTGDELRAPGATLGPGQIHDANSASLAAAVLETGGTPEVLPRAGDDARQISEALLGSLAMADLLVVSGGVSVGRYDHVRDVIERHGSLEFWRIRVQPGKPLAFGRLRDSSVERPVIGLPGNPVSALVTFELFVRPLLRAMLGLSGSGRVRVPAVATERVGKDPERRAYLRVVLASDGKGGYEARAAGGQGSAQLRPLAAANALLIVPEGVEAAEPGSTYDALVIGELP
ncbi:MAG TPA: gephyrin-like molybdotransferase Glp [Candidatus Limnocylindrales bacterium]|nr:gephyrin-like molybdotransferase Glp [Candidatus Limnocylindrales bacterium]